MTTNYEHAGTVISGTLRPQDLIPAFLAKLEVLSPERARDIERDFPLVLSELEHAGEGNMPEAEGELVEALTDALNELAPEGWYFGTLEGDGADFGFWEDHDGEAARMAELAPRPNVCTSRPGDDAERDAEREYLDQSLAPPKDADPC